MAVDGLNDDEMRALVVDTMNNHPDASLDVIQNRLRARTGRQLESTEIARLQQIYSGEGFAAGASVAASSRAAQVATLESLSHSRPNAKELIGLFAGIAPMFIHLQANTPKAGATATYFDLIALVGGIVALIAGGSAYFLLQSGPQRRFHVGVVALILMLGIYQLALGLGLLHRVGIYRI